MGLVNLKVKNVYIDTKWTLISSPFPSFMLYHLSYRIMSVRFSAIPFNLVSSKSRWNLMKISPSLSSNWFVENSPHFFIRIMFNKSFNSVHSFVLNQHQPPFLTFKRLDYFSIPPGRRSSSLCTTRPCRQGNTTI